MVKKKINIAVVLVTLTQVSATALAQDAATYPSNPITLVVPYAVGGPADMLGRMVGEKLSSRLGRPVIIDNRPGAGGHIGGNYVAHAAPDGHTLMLGTIAHHGAAALYKGLKYDPTRDLKPVIVIAESPSVLLIHKDVPVKNVQELVALAKKSPSKLTYASAGTGSAMHMSAELFKSMAGVDMLHIPYKGGAPAMNDLLGGQVNLLFENIGTAYPHLSGGKVRPLAVTSAERSPSMPDIPTVAESGIPNYSSVPWYTIAVAKGVPDAIVDKLNTEINHVLKSPELAQRWNSVGVIPVGGTVADAVKRNEVERKKWSAVITSAGLKAE